MQNTVSTAMTIVAVAVGTPIVVRTIRAALHGHFATDIVASLSIVGAIALGQPLVALVIVAMQTGGEALEWYAGRRASATLRALESRAPRIAHVVRGTIIDEEIPVDSVRVGDVLLVRAGEVVACDGVIIEGDSELDMSSLTGEVMPVRATTDTRVMSGTVNGMGSFRMRVIATAERSQYAKVVSLVRSAQASKAPLQRLADRYAVWFTPITLVLCGIAVALTHDWTRALAILVVATPCPLILATPVAIIGGINRSAKRGVIIRRSAALERLAEVTAVVFDKTGTITIGRPAVRVVRVASGFDRDAVLRCAAALEQHSSHLLARVTTDYAIAERIAIPASSEQVETPGQGMSGRVDGHSVRVGARAFVIPACENGFATADALEQNGATLRAYVSVDDRLAAVIEYADQVRPELALVLSELTKAGVRRIALLSGDHAPIARGVASTVGIQETYGDLLPDDKARLIERIQADGNVVMMIGDGINDAPALSTADIGIALSAGTAGIATEAADAVILVDALDSVPDVMAIGRRTIRIARQSIRVGLGLSAVAMIVAAFGGLAPVSGALFQELIDIAVILNALRTSREPLSIPFRHGSRRTYRNHGVSEPRLA